MMRGLLLGLVVLLGALATQAAPPLEVMHVQHDPAAFDPTEGETVGIRFHLSRPAVATVHVYDGRDLEIRSLGSPEPLPVGDASILWDGRDSQGRLVPPEAYHYTVTARAADGGAVEYDVTDRTRDEEVTVEQARWDPETKRIRYVLPKPARVAVRVGLERGGPLLGTVLDWVPRLAGAHEEPWDGRDASGVLDLTHHPHLAVGVHAFALPANAILVGPPPREVRLVRDLPAETPRRVTKRTPPNRVQVPAQQPIETRGDVSLALAVASEFPKNDDGLPVVSGPVPLRLEVATSERGKMWDRRFEAVFYVDGTFVYEVESGFLPLTWRWDPTGMNAGEHYVTVNLRGYEGNFGAATLRVWVAGPPEAPPTAGGAGGAGGEGR